MAVLALELQRDLPSADRHAALDPFSNLIEVYVNRVRRKIDGGRAKPLLHTRRGAGYVLGVGEDNVEPNRRISAHGKMPNDDV